MRVLPLYAVFLNESDNPYEKKLTAMLRTEYAKASPQIKLLLSHGFVPVPRGSAQTAFLGAGISAIAYDCVKDGKRVVAKITSSDEAEGYKDMSAMLSRFPKRISKHFATVHEIIETNVDEIKLQFPEADKIRAAADIDKDLHDDIGNIYTIDDATIVSMEHLQPLPKSFANAFWGMTSEPETIANARLVSSDRNALAKRYITFAKRPKAMLALFHATELVLVQKVISALATAIKDNDSGVNKIINAISGVDREAWPWTLAKELVSDIIEKNESGDIDESRLHTFVVDRIADNFYMFLRHEIYSDKFPATSSWATPTTYTKRVNELIAALRYLQKHINLDWTDLHEKNIMMRSDGTLVVSDFGNFFFDS